nr:hypothetical protein [uncultured Jannaschia sp.]
MDGLHACAGGQLHHHAVEHAALAHQPRAERARAHQTKRRRQAQAVGLPRRVQRVDAEGVQDHQRADAGRMARGQGEADWAAQILQNERDTAQVETEDQRLQIAHTPFDEIAPSASGLSDRPGPM